MVEYKIQFIIPTKPTSSSSDVTSFSVFSWFVEMFSKSLCSSFSSAISLHRVSILHFVLHPVCVQKLTNKVSCLMSYLYSESYIQSQTQSHLLIKLIGDGSYQLLNCQIYFLHVFCRSIDLGYFSVDKLLPIQQCNMQDLEASALRVWIESHSCPNIYAH